MSPSHWSSERGWLKSIRRRLIVALVGGLGSLLVVMFLLLDQMLDLSKAPIIL